MADTQTLRGLDDVLRKLKSLPSEIVSKRGGPVKSALRKGAKVVADEWVKRIRDVVSAPEESGYVSTDTLAKAVTVSRDPRPQQSGANERYRMHVRRRTYPDGTKTIATARYLELGTELRPPTPTLTPAYFSSRQRALTTVVDELGKGIAKVIRKMEATR